MSRKKKAEGADNTLGPINKPNSHRFNDMSVFVPAKISASAWSLQPRIRKSTVLRRHYMAQRKQIRKLIEQLGEVR
jgi:hypothetical protein